MTTSSYTAGPITHTVEILTIREAATETITPLITHIRDHLPKIRIERRRETWIRHHRLAA